MINHPPNDTTLLWYDKPRTACDQLRVSFVRTAGKNMVPVSLLYNAVYLLAHTPQTTGTYILSYTYREMLREAVIERMANLKVNNSMTELAYQAAIKEISSEALNHILAGQYDKEMPDVRLHFAPHKKNTDLEAQIYFEIDTAVVRLKSQFDNRPLVNIIFEVCCDQFKEYERISRITKPYYPLN